MLYLDTSVLVSALTNEADTGAVQDWLAAQVARDLAISDWGGDRILFRDVDQVADRTNSARTIARRRWRRLRVWPRRRFGSCRWSGHRFEPQRGSPTNRHSVCAPATLCIWRYVPNRVPRFAPWIVDWVKPRRWSASDRSCCEILGMDAVHASTGSPGSGAVVDLICYNRFGEKVPTVRLLQESAVVPVQFCLCKWLASKWC
jgi:hypothetical protein